MSVKMESNSGQKGFIILILALMMGVFLCLGLTQTAHAATYVAGKVSSGEAKHDMYRLYNPNSGEHFYTASAVERDGLARIGWSYEGVGWVAPNSSKTPVYRMYNPNSGDHHYTVSAQERDNLSRIGWRYEGVGWYSDDKKRVPLLRAFNPNEVVGTHHYTTSKAELDQIVGFGWRNEGVGWYAVEGGRLLPPASMSLARCQAIINSAPTSPNSVVVTNGTINPVAMADLQRCINALGGTPMGFCALNVNTGKCVTYNANFRQFSASSIKAPYIASICYYNAPNLMDSDFLMRHIVETSNNESYAELVSRHGKWYLQNFARESGVDLDLDQYAGCYVDYSPRDIAKFWAKITDWIRSGGQNSSYFRHLWEGEMCKEGWMYEGSWCGPIHNVTGSQANVVYGIMTKVPDAPSSINHELRDALIRATW